MLLLLYCICGMIYIESGKQIKIQERRMELWRAKFKQ